MILDGALINPKLVGQNIDGNAVGVSLDELLHLGWFEAPADPSLGFEFSPFWAQMDHFEEVPETFSLVRMVQVTSHYLHQPLSESYQVEVSFLTCLGGARECHCDAEVTEVRRLVEGSRLVTLTGPGGVGKTRLDVDPIHVRHYGLLEDWGCDPPSPQGARNETAR